MPWNKIAPYKQLFISALILMGIYLIFSRIAGALLGPDTLNYPKILRWIIGLLFVLVAVKIYIFSPRQTMEAEKTKE